MDNMNNMDNIIKNYQSLSLEDKYINCTDKLLETENNISKLDEMILNEWYSIQNLNLFKDQRDYFDYMLSLSNYEKLMNIKKNLEFEIIHLDTLFQNENDIIPMQESKSLHMEQLEH